MGNKRVLFLSGIYWNDTLQRHQQFAKYFLKRGYSVDFVEHIISTKFTFKKLLQIIKRKKNNSQKNYIPYGINVINSGFVNPMGGIFGLYNKVQLKKIMPQLNYQYDIVINYLPVNTTFMILNNIDYKYMVYDCVRSFSDWGGCCKNIEVLESELVNKSDVVFTDSYYLTNKIKNINPNKKVVQFLPIITKEWKHSVEMYYGKINKKIRDIAYFGNLDSHNDIQLLEELAKKGMVIHIWGKINCNLTFKYNYHGYLSDLGNLAKEIMENVQAIILPYRGNMNGVIPAKIMQSLYTGLPVFINSFYDTDIMKKYLYVYRDQKHLFNMLDNFSEETHQSKLTEIFEFVKDKDDENQYEQLCKTIEENFCN